MSRFYYKSNLIGLVSCVVLTSCVNNPYALRISDIDESTPQKSAVILVSDPQIYARESLINDRRREAAYLEDELEKSKNAVFTPQINRELQAFNSIGLSLSAGIDPAAGRQYRDANTDAPLTSEIQQAQQDIRLLQLQQQLQSLQNRPEEEYGQAPASNEQIAALEQNIAEQNTKIETLEGKIGTLEGDEDRRTLLENLRDRRDNADSRLQNRLPAAGRVQSSGIVADPRDQFRDRQSFRSELRAALAEAQLDDAHDVNSNSLYRLQLRTTVLPGEKKAKYGVARLTVEPPSLTLADVASLYRTWLSHINYRAFQSVANQNQSPEQAFLGHSSGTVGRGYGIYTISRDLNFASAGSAIDLTRAIQDSPESFQATASLTKESDALRSLAFNERNTISIALPEGIDPQLLLNFLNDKEFERASKDLDTYIEHLSEAGKKSCNSWTANNRKRYVQEIRNTAFVYDYTLSALINAQQAYEQSGGDAASSINRLVLTVVSQGQRRVETISQKVKKIDATVLGDNKTLESCDDVSTFKDYVSDDFLEGLNIKKSAASGSKFLIKDSKSFAYATSPFETAQQVSTLASALSTLEVGLAISASDPTAGTSLGGAADFASAAQGRISALERQPTVIGFADRIVTQAQTPKNCEKAQVQQGSLAVGSRGASKDGIPISESLTCLPTTTQEGDQRAQFGWVFGPKVTVDARRQRLRLEHVPRNYQGTADIAVPGWWPFVELQTETAWIDTWTNGLEPLKDVEIGRERFRVDLPFNRSDLDAITDAISRRYSGRTIPQTQLVRVEPRYVAACQTEVSFLLTGQNLWRATEVFLSGRRHREIRVMPDMAGIVASFNIENLPVLENRNGEVSPAKLQVWTRDGPSRTVDIELSSARVDGHQCFEATGPRSTVNAILTPRTKSLVLGASNRLEFDITSGALPTSFSSIKIDARERRPNALGYVSPSAAPVIIGSTISQTFTKAELDRALTGLPGASLGAVRLESQLNIIPRPGAAAVFSPQGGSIVVYRDAAASRPSVTGGTKIAALDTPFTIDLPAFFNQAYPALAKSGEVRARFGTPAIALTGRYTVNPDSSKATVTLNQNSAISKDGDITVTAIGPVSGELAVDGTNKVKLDVP